MQIKVLYFLLFLPFQVVPYDLAVRIPGFHSGGPGSTPGSIFDFASSDIIGCFILRRSKDSGT